MVVEEEEEEGAGEEDKNKAEDRGEPTVVANESAGYDELKETDAVNGSSEEP